MHIIQGDEDTEGFKNAIEKCVDDLSFRWNIYHEMVDITSKAIIIPHYEKNIELKEAEVKQNPTDDKLKNEYKNLLEMHSSYKAAMTFDMIISSNVDLDTNKIIFPNCDASECEWDYLKITQVYVEIVINPQVHFRHSHMYLTVNIMRD